MIDSIKGLRQWLLWDAKGQEKRPRSVNGYAIGANANYRHEWRTHAECVASESYGHLGGVGFVFTESDDLFGVDIDDCIVDGEILVGALEVLDRFRGTYAELSPSGTGVHIFCRGMRLDPTWKKTVHVGAWHIEAYDRGRYFTVTGQHLAGHAEDVTDQAEAMRWLVDRFGFATAESSLPVAVASPRVLRPMGRLADRLVAYVEACEVQVAGGRNAALYRACADWWGWDGITRDDVAAAAAMLNARFHPPMDAAEVEQVVDKALQYRQDRPTKVWSPAPVEPVIDFAANLVGAPPELESPDEPDTDVGPMPQEFLELPGVLGWLCQWIESTSRYAQPELTLGAALSYWGMLLGQKLEWDGTRTNWYGLGIAPAGSGKDHARRCIYELTQAVDDVDALGGERAISAAGITTRLKSHGRTLYLLDEIGKQISQMHDARSNAYHICSLWLQLYSSAGHRHWQIGDYAAGAAGTIHYPHLCLWGTSTDTFLEKLRRSDIEDGLLPRFAVFTGQYGSPRRIHAVPPPGRLLDVLRAWRGPRPDDMTDDEILAEATASEPDGSQIPQAVTMSIVDDARDRLDRHHEDIAHRRIDEYRQSPARAALWSRAAEKSAKLSMMLAASRMDGPAPRPTITMADADMAVRMANWMTRKMVALFQRYGVMVSNEVERDHRRLLGIIEKFGPISQRDLSRKTQWLKAYDRTKMLETLAESGQIQVEETEFTSGNGTVRKRLVFSRC